MNSTIDATEPEPIVVAFSDGRRHTLEMELTRRIWQEVERGHYSGPEEFINRALDALFAGDIQHGQLEAEGEAP